MLNETEDFIADAIAGADEFRESRPNESKQRLLVDRANPDHTVAALRDILANSGDLFDRGVPVRITYNQTQHGHAAQPLTPHGLILNAHSFCRPFAIKVKNGDTSEVDIGLPFPFARMYLDWRGEWKLPPLNGIATAPLLHEDGAIVSAKGYDRSSGMWCENVPDLTGLVPERPTKDQAATALLRIRETFKTFCFADAETVEETARGVPVVDLTRAPGQDESSFLVASLTAVCRPSLHLAPGVLIRAAPLSGAGAGKGLLARCMCIIAFGREPHAVTSGATGEEMEKRIGAELIAASPALFLDNLNNTTFKSDLLASAITERPAKVRMLGRSEMVLLNASALVLLTGNGITVSEDLARRFIEIELDPRIENPEARPFTTDIRTEVMRRRSELLGALLTIWRWGRIATGLEKGLPLGSFDQWCQWVRDPLLVLGCHDPVLRLTAAKERDARRQNVAEIFTIWWERHGKNPVALSGLHEDVKNAADPQSRGRQYLSAFFDRLAGTRMVGFILTRQAAPGKWGVATYALKKTDDGHRDHRGRQAKTDISDDPYGPNADLHRKAA